MTITGKGKYIDKRANNGGSRKGAGRPKSPWRLAIEEQLMQDVVVPELRHGQIRRVKKPLLRAILDELVKKGLKGDVRSILAYLDVVVGKPGVIGGNIIKQQRFPAKLKIIKKNAALRYYKPPKF